MIITVVGLGYVGLSNAILLAQNNKVSALEIVEEKVEMINNKKSPIVDKEISDYLATKSLDLFATSNIEEAYKDAELIIIATPTNYDEETNHFDTSLVEVVLDDVNKYNKSATVLIKSTIPVGYTDNIRKEYPELDIIFSPEFLREGTALYDNLHPSRIIVGNESPKAEMIANLFKEGAIDSEIEVLLMPSTEAEAVKLFSNTYLALRISYFNELDTYAELKGLNTKNIIEGVGLDPRIGDHYNNPSFGYGGYCLPKDTKQLLANYHDVPNNLIKAIVDSNVTRKSFIASQILGHNIQIVGIYRLTMKAGSDNFRQSAIFDIIEELEKNNIEIVIYEPTIDSETYNGFEVLNDINKFKEKSDIILANRNNNDDLTDVIEKVYSRDIFGNN